MEYKNVLAIGGSDPTGGAGIQADLKTFTALGVYGAAAVTCVTVQDTRQFYGANCLDPGLVKDQILRVLEDIDIGFIKVGMLGSADIARAVGECVQGYAVVCDPVLVSTSGGRLLEDKAVKALKEHVIARSALLTPNYHELKKLTGGRHDIPAEASRALLDKFPGLKAVLAKGGHYNPTDRDEVEDILVVRDGGGYKSFPYQHARYKTENTHGTGCTLSSAITAYLARNNDLVHAVEMGIDYVTGLIELSAGAKIGKGPGPLLHNAGMKL